MPGLCSPATETDGRIDLPHRRRGNHYGMVDGELVLLSESMGQRLSFLVEPDSPAADQACALLTEQLLPLLEHPRLELGQINDLPARKSPYLPVLAQHASLHSDHKGVFIEVQP